MNSFEKLKLTPYSFKKSLQPYIKGISIPK